ncbi:MAG: hypothetical protein FD145_418 [Candidatus Saganbacteria bacterium]|uniref:VCBS repeat-containing protein n=1 Tax=Candidatus Saganbacteria bacterium TaxID=2575572 RepID=A0A833L1Z7_UNCSA|nr:MAG: hypothetical protein FD145_418 [Candidatus Saganbacteria bacterium]
MGKVIVIFFHTILFFVFPVLAKDVIMEKYSTDINNDGKVEYLIHEFFGGTGAYGILTIYADKGEVILKEKTQGDPFFKDPNKHIYTLNPQFFKDVDKDGILEILIGHQEYQNNTPNFSAPWVFKTYKWNGKKYISS